jgi:hypothetical protein
MDVNLGDAHLDGRQRLDVGIERILAQRDLDLFRFRPVHYIKLKEQKWMSHREMVLRNSTLHREKFYRERKKT